MKDAINIPLSRTTMQLITKSLIAGTVLSLGSGFGTGIGIASVSAETHLMFNTSAQFNYNAYPWHQSFNLLWETLMSIRTRIGIWPTDTWTNYDDIELIFNNLKSAYGNVSPNGFDQDKWALPFLQHGKELYSQAKSYEGKNNTLASEMYLCLQILISLFRRTASVFRLGWFPWVHSNTSHSSLKKACWDLEKQTYERGLALAHYSFETVNIPFKLKPHDSVYDTIPIYVNYALSKGKRNGGSNRTKAKTVILVCGLDRYRSGQLTNVQLLLSLGMNVITVDMPGTGDAPITGRDTGADTLLWRQLLDWIEANAGAKGFDKDNLWAWGTSTGSYWSIKLSRAEKNRLKGVLAQGAASHYTFTRDWLESADHLSYAVDLWAPLASTFGYVDDKHAFADVASNYSLLNQGVLDQDAAKLLSINGVEDTTFPIDDTLILSYYGKGAFLRMAPGFDHMGEPAATEWLQNFWAAVADGSVANKY
ncbi:alpha/beta-hydrolase [Tilletiaria anomala UBC 951]|uniref:Alpha/beta-hydrolase n=1 Tax=Tilletiaria anomala (strain ATCC 24038 / CBS 436.72 / UBC 951) TaxID=1037660 RepID=A0A066VTF9_TILAU|nr:alpha/beta-hydrolase [Tilletiaria anomala UBC 951]KDN44761.1 alpha/beta-hydrolase [Tilletiaria anomala UBC 951]